MAHTNNRNKTEVKNKKLHSTKKSTNQKYSTYRKKTLSKYQITISVCRLKLIGTLKCSIIQLQSEVRKYTQK